MLGLTMSLSIDECEMNTFREDVFLLTCKFRRLPALRDSLRGAGEVRSSGQPEVTRGRIDEWYDSAVRNLWRAHDNWHAATCPQDVDLIYESLPAARRELVGRLNLMNVVVVRDAVSLRASSDTDEVLPRFLAHWSGFAHRCVGCSVVSNGGIYHSIAQG